MEEKIHGYWSLDGKTPAANSPTNADAEIKKFESRK